MIRARKTRLSGRWPRIPCKLGCTRPRKMYVHVWRWIHQVAVDISRWRIWLYYGKRVRLYRRITCTRLSAYPIHEFGSSIRRSGSRTPERLTLKNDEGNCGGKCPATVWNGPSRTWDISRKMREQRAQMHEQRATWETWYLYLIFTMKGEIANQRLPEIPNIRESMC